VTGHREANDAFAANRTAIEAAFARILETIEAAVEECRGQAGATVGTTRLHCLLAEGADHLAANAAFERGWALVAPLPFGRRLNTTIGAHAASVQDAWALLAGEEPSDQDTRERAQLIDAVAELAHLFELADCDGQISQELLAALGAPHDPEPARHLAAQISKRVALAARVMIEQSDILIGIWDGATSSHVGGTGHTIASALELGAAVVWIDASRPEQWRVLESREALALRSVEPESNRLDRLQALVRQALRLDGTGASAAAARGVAEFDRERWPASSNILWHTYRRVEALFGGDPRPFRSLRQRYERPDRIAVGSGAQVLETGARLGGQSYAARIREEVLGRFAWADAVSAHLSDAYRGNMTASFVLSALAIIAGISYQPFAGAERKWIFAALEFSLLALILVVTALGQRLRWHSRWFETRRVAEYFRHAPALLMLGVARAPGRWPVGSKTSWPEDYARHSLRALGLPPAVVTPTYLRTVLREMLDRHVVRQRDYHEAKARRLTRVHHNLDRISLRLFQAAVLSVSVYLLLTGATALALMPGAWLERAAKLFTFFGVLFPTLGAALAGIRYFGDFERFAAISEVTARKLSSIHDRIDQLLAAADAGIDYDLAANIARAMDEVVVSEIENWQAVFGGKHITVPV
jgi:hypothetical protein